jgi:two-component system, LuxR family, response regulator FixJ
MNSVAETIPYRSFLNRDRLVYIAHPDAAVSKALCDEFIAHGFQVSLVPDRQSLSQQIASRRPDLVIMALCDHDGAVEGAVVALDAIRAQHLGIQTFLLAPEDVRAERVSQAMKHGACWVFSPPFVPVDIVKSAEDTFRSDLHLMPSKDGRDEVTVKGFGTLTYRERQILQFVVEGRTNKEIAGNLGLSYRTVEVHRRHIMEKIGARNTAELVRLAMES